VKRLLKGPWLWIVLAVVATFGLLTANVIAMMGNVIALI